MVPHGISVLLGTPGFAPVPVQNHTSGVGNAVYLMSEPSDRRPRRYDPFR